MLCPVSSQKDLAIPALLELVAQRDNEIQSEKVESLRVFAGATENTVKLNDYPNVQSFKEIAHFLEVPDSFMKKADLPLAQHIVDHQLKKVKADKEIVLRNNKAIGSQPAGRQKLSGVQIIEKMINGVGNAVRANFYDLGSYVDVALVGEKITLEPKLNDITHGGVRCLYSEIMARAPTIEPYVERLVCLNGMIMSDKLTTFKFESMHQFIRDLEGSVTAAMAHLDTVIRAQLLKAVETPVENGEQAIRQIFSDRNLNARLLGPTQAALTIENDGTAFGVLQAITRAANATDYSHRITLQQVGAKEAARLDKVHCPACWSSLVH